MSRSVHTRLISGNTLSRSDCLGKLQANRVETFHPGVVLPSPNWKMQAQRINPANSIREAQATRASVMASQLK